MAKKTITFDFYCESNGITDVDGFIQYLKDLDLGLEFVKESILDEQDVEDLDTHLFEFENR